AIHLILAARDGDYSCAVDLSAQNFRGLEIGRDEDPCFESAARRLGRHGVGEIAGGGTCDGIECEVARLGQRHCDYTILDDQSGLADGVILVYVTTCSSCFAE